MKGYSRETIAADSAVVLDNEDVENTPDTIEGIMAMRINEEDTDDESDDT